MEEREYILLPHPEAFTPKEREPPKPEEPIVAEFTLSDLIRQTVQQEMRRERIANAENQELPDG